MQQANISKSTQTIHAEQNSTIANKDKVPSTELSCVPRLQRGLSALLPILSLCKSFMIRSSTILFGFILTLKRN